jgi:branched-chain amino acid transport system permease protein
MLLAGAPQYLVSGLTQGAAYGLIGLGFTMIFNTTGIINFAQGEFVMLGGMLTVWFLGLGLPLPLAVLAACLATACLGALMERLTIRPLTGAPALNAVIVTIGVSILFRGGAMLAFGKDTAALPAFTGVRPIMALGAAIQPQSLWVLAVTLALLAALKLFFTATIQGKAMLACACQPKAASLVGISVARMALLSFAISGLIGACAGAILAPITMTAYDVGMLLGVKGFAACILGGLGNPFGAAAGGLVLGVLESFGAGYVSSGYKDAFAFVVLLLLLFARPSGLFGKAGVERV